MAIELPLFSRIMQTRYHLEEFRERNLILRRAITFCLLKGASVPSEFLEIFVYLFCKKSLVSNETGDIF